jgi:hypothetical protein
MAENQWVVTFEDVQDPAQMRTRLDNSQFAKKCSSFMSRVVGHNLVSSFSSIVGKQALQKKCAQTFKDYGTFKTYTITQTSGQLNNGKSGNPEKWNTCVLDHNCRLWGAMDLWAYAPPLVQVFVFLEKRVQHTGVPFFRISGFSIILPQVPVQRARV